MRARGATQRHVPARIKRKKKSNLIPINKRSPEEPGSNTGKTIIVIAILLALILLLLSGSK